MCNFVVSKKTSLKCLEVITINIQSVTKIHPSNGMVHNEYMCENFLRILQTVVSYKN